MNLETSQLGWRSIRDSATQDTAIVLKSGGGLWSAMEDLGKPIQRRDNAVSLRFRATTTITSIVFTVYVGYKGDDAEFVCTGTATCDATAGNRQDATKTNAGVATFYMDKIVISRERWLTKVGTTDVSGNDEMAKLSFDACGRQYIFVEMTTITDSGSGTASVDMVGW